MTMQLIVEIEKVISFYIKVFVKYRVYSADGFSFRELEKDRTNASANPELSIMKEGESNWQIFQQKLELADLLWVLLRLLRMPRLLPRSI